MSHACVIACCLMLSGTALSPLTASQNFPELARRLGPPPDGKPIPVPSSPGEYWRTTIEDVAREAVVVLRATLSRKYSYLAPSEDRILTDYTMVNPQVIAGVLPVTTTETTGAPPPLTLTVWGGEAIVEGVPMRSVNVDIEPINDGGEYLLFLRPDRTPGPGRYEIYYGAIFEVSQELVRPLLRNARDIFSGTADTRLTELVARIGKARQVR